MLQLNPPLWLETPKGIGLCHLVTWDSLEHSVYWQVADEQTGQSWIWPNERIRLPKNITADRINPEKP